MKKYIPYIAVAVLAVMYVVRLFRPEEVREKVTVVRDTMYVTRWDTLFYENVKYVRDTIVDYVVINTPDSVSSIPITQRFYKEDSFQAWVSGYRPSLDSIDVFQKTEYVYVTQDVERKIYPSEYSFYLNADMMAGKGFFGGIVSLTMNTPDIMSYRIGIGYSNHGMVYQAGIGIKLFEYERNRRNID